MKARSVIITLAVVASLTGGGIYGAYRYARSQRKPVSVYPVSNLNMMSDWFSDDSSIYGTIISQNTQTVSLSSQYALEKVYVEAGDNVKIGDPLLEYDMTLQELEREMQDLKVQTLQLQLQSEERELEKFLKDPNSVLLGSDEISAGLDYAAGDDDLTASADELIEDDTIYNYPGSDEDLEAFYAREDLLSDPDAGMGDTLILSDGPGSGNDLIEDDDLIEDLEAITESADDELFEDDEEEKEDSLIEEKEETAGIIGGISENPGSVISALSSGLSSDLIEEKEISETDLPLSDQSSGQNTSLIEEKETSETDLPLSDQSSGQNTGLIEEEETSETDLPLSDQSAGQNTGLIEEKETSETDLPLSDQSSGQNAGLIEEEETSETDLPLSDQSAGQNAGLIEEEEAAEAEENTAAEITDEAEELSGLITDVEKVIVGAASPGKVSLLAQRPEVVAEELSVAGEEVQNRGEDLVIDDESGAGTISDTPVISDNKEDLSDEINKEELSGEISGSVVSDTTDDLIFDEDGNNTVSFDDEGSGFVEDPDAAGSVGSGSAADQSGMISDGEAVSDSQDPVQEQSDPSQDTLVEAPEDDSPAASAADGGQADLSGDGQSSGISDGDPFIEGPSEDDDPAAASDTADSGTGQNTGEDMMVEAPEDQAGTSSADPTGTSSTDPSGTSSESQIDASSTELPGTDLSGNAGESYGQDSETEAGTDNETEYPDTEESSEETVYEDYEAESETENTVVEEEEVDEELIRKMKEFLLLESLLRSWYTDSESMLSLAEIEQALMIFRNELAEMPSKEAGTINTFRDAFGEKREEPIYMLSSRLIATLDLLEKQSEEEDDTFSSIEAQTSLYHAFCNVLLYQLIVRMNILNQAFEEIGTTPAKATLEEIEQLRPQIQAAADAYYEFDVNWYRIRQVMEKTLGVSDIYVQTLDESYKNLLALYSGEDNDLKDSAEGFLSKAIARMNRADVVEETEGLETEPFTEYEPDDFDEGDYDGDDYSYTKEDLEEMLRSLKDSVAETRLDIREAQLELKKRDRVLEGKVVKASMNGTVKEAGAMGSARDDSFIVISGDKGMYVQGTVNELSRDTIKIGDVITGSSDENGVSFTASVTEVSVYPTNNDDYSYGYYGMSQENSNASYYPFLAYIEDASELVEGSATMTFASAETSSSGIDLEKAYVRTDITGKNYVYKMGEDGLLVKQYVKTEAGVWGSDVKITEGLSNDDHIAFPYGKNVVEGAKTVVSSGYYEDEYEM